MKREEKVNWVAAMHARFERASVALVATNKGLSVEQANRLRRTVRSAGGEYKVAKHTLTRRAVGETRYRDLSRLLRGPQGVVFGYKDPVALTKAVVDFANEIDRLALDGGVVEGQLIAADQVKALAMMPGVDVLRGRVVRQALSPATRMAAIAATPARRIAGAIAALVEKIENAGPTA